jgi:hypothetical protein
VLLGRVQGRTRDLRTPVRVRAQTDLDLCHGGSTRFNFYPAAYHHQRRGWGLVRTLGLSALHCGSVTTSPEPRRLGLSICTH